jgi:hypothetical protein
MENVTSRLVWCVRPKRLTAYTRQIVWLGATLVGVMKQARKDAPGALRNEDVGSASSTNGTDTNARWVCEEDGARFSEQESAGERSTPPSPTRAPQG